MSTGKEKHLQNIVHPGPALLQGYTGLLTQNNDKKEASDGPSLQDRRVQCIIEKPFKAHTSPQFFLPQKRSKATEEHKGKKLDRDGSETQSHSGCSESQAWLRRLQTRGPREKPPSPVAGQSPAFPPAQRGASRLEERRPSHPSLHKGTATASSKL